MLETNLALGRRYFSRVTGGGWLLDAQMSLASCLGTLGRLEESLVLQREIYARRLAISGASHEGTIISGSNLLATLNMLGRWDEAKPLARDQLLPAARQSLGADHDTTLKLTKNLACTLADLGTRGDLR